MPRHTAITPKDAAITCLVLALAASCGPRKPTEEAASRAGAAATPPAVPRIADPEGDVDARVQGRLADIRFDYDRADIREDARPILERNAAVLAASPGVRLVVEGHCDERGSVEYNLALGERRARAARDYLVRLGVASERLTTVSYGKEQPADTGHGEASWAVNRRAHFLAIR
jgi:peptidoglycan-associated lipoprotein